MIANCNKYFSQQHHTFINHPQESSTATKSSAAKIMSNPADVSGATTSAMNNNNNNAAHTANGMSSPAIANKMGSRRIFSPHFKIQVLDSYRNDGDCKGNQRATARKYGIHRRQIQKWLQCESALRTSVSSNSGTTSPPTNSTGSKLQVDSNNNNSHQKRTLSGAKATAALLSTSSSSSASSSSSSSKQARHSVVVDEAIDDATTQTRQNSMEFFSPSTTSLIINGGPDRKIESMNEAAVPIKPEFCFSPSTAASHPSSTISHSGFEMPSTAAAAMLKHQHHLQHQDVPQSHNPLMSAVTTLPPPFISTIYGPQNLLAFPCAFPFEYPPPLPVPQPHHHHHHLSPIDLSVGNAERRHAGDSFRCSPPTIQVDDARVPSRSVCVDQGRSSNLPLSEESAVAPIDLSCSRKRRAGNEGAAEPVKPPKLFKPYLLDDHEEEEELKVVDEEEVQSTKRDSFLDRRLTGLKDKLSHRFEYPTAVYATHQYYPGSSPAYESLYYGGHENLTLYPSPREYESSPSAESSPLHHPSRPASFFDSSSSEGTYSQYLHPSSPTSSVRSSPPVFSSSSWAPTAPEMRARLVLGSVC